LPTTGEMTTLKYNLEENYPDLPKIRTSFQDIDGTTVKFLIGELRGLLTS
jgi:hypothetical protein